MPFSSEQWDRGNVILTVVRTLVAARWGPTAQPVVVRLGVHGKSSIGN
jgi:hypothetical protein